jgi:two-component system response regulator YesN
MAYKVFLVEDEIVTREGIRDNVDWRSMGFEFCGEAPDGEIALPLIPTRRHNHGYQNALHGWSPVMQDHS